ncbi:hypothetical protein ACQCT6_08365 [Cytobacillus gottheilii]|uniref:Uncharacterized protein n=1 Tax=Cytobacillus gottheilii TaxID=859144 RepID=A0ABX8F8V2_9BACI|nr:hypothetical protein [Cytobacillus gottheilii]QVY59972.1 hypothetical protein J1899_13030 [Cytobacillus gottheilii]
MESDKKNSLSMFIHEDVEIAIIDTDGEDQAPLLTKRIERIENCPDHTHFRMYVNHLQFLAIPMEARFEWKNDRLVATDENSQLQYCIRKITNN